MNDNEVKKYTVAQFRWYMEEYERKGYVFTASDWGERVRLDKQDFWVGMPIHAHYNEKEPVYVSVGYDMSGRRCFNIKHKFTENEDDYVNDLNITIEKPVPPDEFFKEFV